MDATDPGFFGPSLFGCYHPPAPNVAVRPGVVLCQPTGHEYAVAHRAMRQLARQLASAGHPVLRFDFYGCGDSGGAAREGRLSRWRDDLDAAIEELRRHAAAARVVLIGARTGATVAWAVAANRRDVGALAIWDPVIDGAAYLNDLRREHAMMLKSSHVAPPPGSSVSELLGFETSAEGLAELAAVRLPESEPALTMPVLWVDQEETAGHSSVVTSLRRSGLRVDHEVIPGGVEWRWVENPAKVLVPPAVLRRIVAWSGEARA